MLIRHSVWIFLLLGVEAIKTYRVNPHFEYVNCHYILRGKCRTELTLLFRISSYKIPTWISPLVIIVMTSVFIPNTSFLGHLCGCVVGYLCESTRNSSLCLFEVPQCVLP